MDKLPPERPTFPGLSARDAERRLKSCGLQTGKIERYKPQSAGHVWKAETDKGVRYASWDGTRWSISKEPPCTHAHEEPGC